jgi:DNA-binding NtrC family response regulator
MVAKFEKGIIENTLRETQFNRKEAARKLGISQNTLWRKTQE